jgi:hypothetical protein
MSSMEMTIKATRLICVEMRYSRLCTVLYCCEVKCWLMVVA